jgi:hypothetical protein
LPYEFRSQVPPIGSDKTSHIGSEILAKHTKKGVLMDPMLAIWLLSPNQSFWIWSWAGLHSVIKSSESGDIFALDRQNELIIALESLCWEWISCPNHWSISRIRSNLTEVAVDILLLCFSTELRQSKTLLS